MALLATVDPKTLKRVLVEEGYVTSEDVAAAESFSKSHQTPFTSYLLSQGITTPELMGQAMAESVGLRYANLQARQPVAEQVLKIPEELAKKHRVVFVSEENNVVTIATDTPDQKDVLKKLQTVFPKAKVILAYAFPEEIEAAFVCYRKTLETRFSHILQSDTKVAPELLKEILEDAVIYKTSDIHFEPQGTEVVIRFRIDGILHEAGRIPKEHYESVLNRIKVQAHLRIDEHFATQDGAIRENVRGNTVDIRVSIAPTISGEKVTMRLLGNYVHTLHLAEIGLSEKNQKLIEAAAKKPFGMILVTGPTGSGKTTTLYALLQMLNRPEVNITTIEDPVEYRVPTLNQIQVNPATNITFARGLRSIVRQDPDIILVGEIRDQETAEIAVNAALTGHLMLSTFHANDAATAVPRLMDMGVEPFLLASTLEIIVAQRLVRRICPNCRYSVQVSKTEILKEFPQLKNTAFKASAIYKAKGCPSCHNSGYAGRIGIFEIIPITREIEDLALKNPAAKQIWELAAKQGARSLFEDGMEKVENGQTTLEELLRVATPNS